jgi:hypothetical protein
VWCVPFLNATSARILCGRVMRRGWLNDIMINENLIMMSFIDIIEYCSSGTWAKTALFTKTALKNSATSVSISYRLITLYCCVYCHSLVTYSISYSIRHEVCFIILNVKERMAKLNGELDNACHCMKNGTIEGKAVSISLGQTAKDFEVTIYCLMACTGRGFCPLFIVIQSIGSTSKSMSI